MEEKSLEEMMSDLSEGVITTTASTTDEPIVIDMSDKPIHEPVQIVSQSPIPGTEKMTLLGWATKQNIRLLDTKYYEDTNLYTLEEYTKIVPRDIEVPLYTEVKPEVQEMIDESENNFFLQNKDKDMDVLEKEYVKMERDAAVIDARILKIKQEHKEIFDAIEALEKEKEEVLVHKDDYREVIADKLASLGEKKWKGMEVEFTYVAATFKTSFNKKRFEQEQPKLYAQYLDSTPVKAYVKTKLSLLPVLPDDIKEVK